MIFALLIMGAIILLWVYLARIEVAWYDEQEDYLLASYPPFIKAMTRFVEAFDEMSPDQFAEYVVDAEDVFKRLGHGDSTTKSG